MCGIAGFVNPRGAGPQETLGAMTGALAHRGPDDTGTWSDGMAWLGHRRLAIIDRAGGAQPMRPEDSSVTVVYNGEIYNHAELRADLEKRGHRFRTRCDTEILPALWREYGPDMTAHLRGMFAFVLWDASTKTLFGARDRFGQKPLYLWHADGMLAFASEMEALLACPDVPRRMDWEAGRLFFAYGAVTSPRTGFAGVEKLPPAGAFTFVNGAFRSWRYWRVEPEPDWRMRESEALDAFGALLEESVSLRLMSDVPLGAFLSGGLDSSLIAWSMRRLRGEGVRTFSIGFDDAAWDESPFAEKVARHLGTEHAAETVRPDAAGLLDPILRRFGEPFGDSSAIPMWSLCAFARRHVTVALSGDGGDELFGGYARYFAGRLAGIYRLLPAGLRHATVGKLLDHLPEGAGRLRDSLVKSLRQFDRFATTLDDNPANLAPRIFTPAGEAALCAGLPVPDRDPVRERVLRFAALSVPEQMLYIDQESYLPDDINVKVDRMSMAHGLEVRSPFLDHRLAEWAARLPLGLKLQGWTGKRLLKRFAADKLPPDIIRRRKQGFGVPLAAWLRGPLRDLWHETVTPDAAAPLCLPVIEKLWREHQDGRRDHAYPLWHVLVFCRWRRLFGPEA